MLNVKTFFLNIDQLFDAATKPSKTRPSSCIIGEVLQGTVAQSTARARKGHRLSGMDLGPWDPDLTFWYEL